MKLVLRLKQKEDRHEKEKGRDKEKINGAKEF